MSYGVSRRSASTTAIAERGDPVRAIMTSPPATVDVAVSMREAAEQLATEEIGALLVIGDGALGVLSERDLVALVASGADLTKLQAGDVLNSDLVWVAPDVTIRDAGVLMLEAGVRHLPVGDGQNAIGIVSIRDVLAVLVGPAADS
jgi:CBS domain-containing protein